MNDQQKFTNEISQIDKSIASERKRVIAESTTDPRQETYIDYRALNGTIIHYDEGRQIETIRKMPMEELASKLGVTRRTLYDWESLIPDFWEKVRARKKELSSQKRLSMMEDKFFIKAMKWENPIISLKWMEQNSPDWRDPRYKVEHEAGNSWASLFEARNKEIDEIIEGEIVDGNETT